MDRAVFPIVSKSALANPARSFSLYSSFFSIQKLGLASFAGSPARHTDAKRHDTRLAATDRLSMRTLLVEMGQSNSAALSNSRAQFRLSALQRVESALDRGGGKCCHALTVRKGTLL